MGKRNYTDKDVAYQIAQILVREIGLFDRPQNMTLEAAVEQMIDTGAAPLMTYASLANELNQLFGLMEASNKFTALNIDLFLGMLLKESIDFSYKIDGISHRGRIRKKIGRDIPITAIVVKSFLGMMRQKRRSPFFKNPSGSKVSPSPKKSACSCD